MTTAELILRNARVHTLDAAPSRPSAVAVAGGRIVAVGDERDVAELRGRATEVVDLAGAVVTPGLVDGHMHPVLGLDIASGVDLSGCRGLDDVRARLRTAASDPPTDARADGWVRGWGLDPNVFAGAPITAEQIEDALGGRPAMLVLFDGHSALASREALRRAGIDGPRDFTSQSAIVCDRDGRPTGHLLEDAAMSIVRAVVPDVPMAQRRRQLAQLLSAMAATGITGGHVMDLDDDGLALIAELDEAEDLPLRLRLAPRCRPDDDADRMEELVRVQRRRGDLWHVGAVKLFMDGTIDGGTAWLDEPDCFGESTHAYWQDPRDYSAAVARFDEAGIQTATHAIGDAAVRHVLDTVAARRARGSVVRHRIEHIETLPTDLVPRFAELDVTASMQPTHATDYTRADHTDNWSHRLGDERADRAWRCRDILDAGATLVIGSDWPIAPFDPRGILAAAQLRRPGKRPDVAPVRPEQALTAAQALAAYTRGPAVVAGDGDTAGRIAVGCRADLTVFGADPLQVPLDELLDVPIVLTVVAGRIRHRG